MSRKARFILGFALICGFSFLFPVLRGVPQERPLPGTMPRAVYAPFYTIADGFQVMLGMNNTTPRPLTVTPVLYSLAGIPQTLPSLQIAGRSHIVVDLQSWIEPLGADYRTGSLQLNFESRPFAVVAQITLLNENASLAIDVPLKSRIELRSNRLEAIWDKVGDAQMQLAVSNLTAQPLTARLRITQSSGADLKELPIPLPPRHTRVLNLREFLVRGASYGGISLEHDGRPGAVMAQAIVWSQSSGYSGGTFFSDPAAQSGADLHGAGILLGQAHGQVFTGRLLLRNISKLPLTAKAVLNGEGNSTTVGEITLSPGESHEFLVEVPPIAGQAVGIEVSNTGAAGSLIGKWTSASDSSMVEETPLRAVATMLPESGSNPFSLEGDNSAILYLKNTGDEKAAFYAMIAIPDGNYFVPQNEIPPHQTIAVDLRKLRDEQTADAFGNKLPPDMQAGQVRWNRRSGSPLIGRVSILSRTKKISMNMSCPWGCCSPIDAYMVVSPNT